MGNRILLINSEIQKAISEIITYDLKNPNINGIISVIKVNTTPDLDYCKIYLSIYNASDKLEVFNQIKHSAGYIRKELTSRVKLRKVPYLEFLLDDSIDYSEKINNVISQIQEERKATNDYDEN